MCLIDEINEPINTDSNQLVIDSESIIIVIDHYYWYNTQIISSLL